MIYKFNVVVGNEGFPFIFTSVEGNMWGHYWILAEGHDEGKGGLSYGMFEGTLSAAELRYKAHRLAWTHMQENGMIQPRYEETLDEHGN